MSNSGRLTLQKALVYAQIQELTVVLSATVILPIAIHMIPSYGGVPMGSRFLPMFYAPFIAITFLNPHVGLTAAFLAPSLNALITGLPAAGIKTLLTIQLVVFTVLSYLILRKWPKFWGVAPLSYLAALLSSSLILYFIPRILIQKEPLVYLITTLTCGLPGILTLLLINIVVVRRRTNGSNGRTKLYNNQ